MPRQEDDRPRDVHDFPVPMIPGAYEPDAVVEAPTPEPHAPIPDRNTMDAATIADRQLEGGGGVRERRPRRPH